MKASRACFRGRFTIAEVTYAQAAGGGKSPSETVRFRKFPGNLYSAGAAHAPRRPSPRPDTPKLDFTHRLITPIDVSGVRAQWVVTDDRTGERFSVVARPRDEGGDGSTWTLFLTTET